MELQGSPRAANASKKTSEREDLESSSTSLCVEEWIRRPQPHAYWPQPRYTLSKTRRPLRPYRGREARHPRFRRHFSNKRTSTLHTPPEQPGSPCAEKVPNRINTGPPAGAVFDIPNPHLGNPVPNAKTTRAGARRRSPPNSLRAPPHIDRMSDQRPRDWFQRTCDGRIMRSVMLEQRRNHLVGHPGRICSAFAGQHLHTHPRKQSEPALAARPLPLSLGRCLCF
jgi:hypothetical protein